MVEIQNDEAMNKIRSILDEQSREREQKLRDKFEKDKQIHDVLLFQTQERDRMSNNKKREFCNLHYNTELEV